MNFKSLNEKLEQLVEKREVSYALLSSFNIEDFVTFCQNKGYKVTQYMKNYTKSFYKIDINGYKVVFAPGLYTGILKDEPEHDPKQPIFHHDHIRFDSVNYSGYMKSTPLKISDFNSNGEYFEYALKEIIKFANSKLEQNTKRSSLKQNIQKGLDDFETNKKVIGTPEEIIGILKKLNLEDNTELILQLNN